MVTWRPLRVLESASFATTNNKFCENNNDSIDITLDTEERWIDGIILYYDGSINNGYRSAITLLALL